MIVNLMPLDTIKCLKAAERRVIERTNAGALDHSEYNLSFKCHYSGTLGEWAVCKAYGCKWDGEYFEGEEWEERKRLGIWDTAVGEVRATRRPDLAGGMPLYPTDDQVNAPYIWVTLYTKSKRIIQAKLVGWIMRKDGVKSKWWGEDYWGKKCWIVPKDKLLGMELLPTQT